MFVAEKPLRDDSSNQQWFLVLEISAIVAVVSTTAAQGPRATNYKYEMSCSIAYITMSICMC